MRKLGSSPLARGKRRNLIQGGRQPRLIPARAGKTRIDAVYEIARAAHPRSREENEIHSHAASRDGGSSPLARGKLRYNGHWPSPPLAHPRSRGENALRNLSEDDSSGSSPLARGKLSMIR